MITLDTHIEDDVLVGHLRHPGGDQTCVVGDPGDTQVEIRETTRPSREQNGNQIIEI